MAQARACTWAIRTFARTAESSTLHAPELRRGMVKLTPEQQQRFLTDFSTAFTPASGAWGLSGCTLVHLDRADEEIVGEAMTLAWRNAMNAPAKKVAAKTKAARARQARQ
jgi:hypothetical protein